MPAREVAAATDVMWGAHAARLRVSHLVSMAHIEPSGCPPNAILIVRQLADPLPHGLAAADEVMPSVDWQRAMQSALADCFTRAAIPADGFVPADADAVRFRDEAELLACLAQDWLSGDVGARWWWRAWLRAARLSTFAVVTDMWAARPHHVPAAMAKLQQRDAAVRFVSALSDNTARALLAAVAHAYGLPAPESLAEGVLSPGSAEVRGRTNVIRLSADEASGTRPTPAGRRHVDSPWEPASLRGGIPSGLAPEQETLLGLALSLWHAPLLVRSGRFQRRLRAWRRQLAQGAQSVAAAQAATHITPPNVPPSAVAPPQQEHTRPGLDDATAAAPFAAHIEPPQRDLAEGDLGQRRADVEESPNGPDARRDEPVPKVVPPSSQPVREAARQAIGADVRPRFVDVPASRKAVPQPVHEPAPTNDGGASRGKEAHYALGAPPRPRVQIDSTDTQLGGVLFLVNVLERLRFFDHLDDHFGVISALGGWGWLELMARALLGRRRADAAADPIWRVLTELDGRPPSDAFAPAVRLRRRPELPASWQAPRGLPRMRVRPLGCEPRGDLRRLLGLVVPYIHWRLRQALEIQGRLETPVASRLCTRRARLECTATHVDVHMDMRDVDVAVRLAGLDVNPGWVPALGRVVTFYFD